MMRASHILEYIIRCSYYLRVRKQFVKRLKDWVSIICDQVLQYSRYPCIRKQLDKIMMASAEYIIYTYVLLIYCAPDGRTTLQKNFSLHITITIFGRNSLQLNTIWQALMHHDTLYIVCKNRAARHCEECKRANCCSISCQKQDHPTHKLVR